MTGREKDASMTFGEFRRRMAAKPTYVILGVQGSGTNLIANILRRVFDISVVQDRSLILGAAASLVGRDSESNRRRAQRHVYNRLFPGPVQKRLLSRQWFHQARQYRGIEEYIGTAPVSSAADLAAFFYDYHAFLEGRHEKAIKSDDCWQYLAAFPSVLPNRRNILLVRDPRDNANSIMHKDFGPRTVYAASQFVKRQLDIYLSEVEQGAAPSLIVHYETLLTAPKRFVSDFASFSGMDAPPDLDSHLTALNIRETNLEKWRRWSDSDLAISESILWDHLKAFDYPVLSAHRIPVGRYWRLQLRAVDAAKRVPQRLKTLWQHQVLAR